MVVFGLVEEVEDSAVAGLEEETILVGIRVVGADCHLIIHQIDKRVTTKSVRPINNNFFIK